MEKSQTQEKKPLRCAIYTRVSTNDNLEKDFTSLDSQRESGESYITSQKSEGWILSPEHYNDAGFTGGNTDRPALQKLITDIKAGLIDCVVVYKVDRLSRSLLDFSQLLEFFDKSHVAFVSVTQHFNTNTSMGRLTLNILLSFAQFEREIISERTRDKMGAAKKKGKWIGGRPLLGYDIDRIQHKLVVNPSEAKLVKEIFDLYLKEKSLIRVAMILNRKGSTSKRHVAESGRVFGGLEFRNTSIELIIKNPTYTGQVHYRGVLYPGEHEAIINEETYHQAQEILVENRPFDRQRKRAKCTGLLSGILRCKTCNSSMYNTYQVKDNKRYVYYCCLNASKRGYRQCPTCLLNADMVETKVLACLCTISSRAEIKSETWDTLDFEKKISIFKSILDEVNYDGKSEILEINLKGDDQCHSFKVEKSELKRANIPPRNERIKVEPQLRQNLLLAYQIQNVLSEGKAKDLKEISGWLNISPQRINQIANFMLLSPTIQEEIISLPNDQLSLIPEYKLRRITDEIDWQKQYAIWQEVLQNTSRK